MLFAPVPFSEKVYPALKSTPDDFFFFFWPHSPLTAPLSPLLEVSPRTDPPLLPPLSASSHFQNMQAWSQAAVPLSRTTSWSPRTDRTSSLFLAQELHQLPLARLPWGREEGWWW